MASVIKYTGPNSEHYWWNEDGDKTMNCLVLKVLTSGERVVETRSDYEHCWDNGADPCEVDGMRHGEMMAHGTICPIL